jgi:translation initiation factor 2 gamma subunit (eIF-2gamma)
LKRYTITLSDKAQKIYEELKQFERSEWVSQAIIGYEAKTDIDIRLEQLEKRIKQLEVQTT